MHLLVAHYWKQLRAELAMAEAAMSRAHEAQSALDELLDIGGKCFGCGMPHENEHFDKKTSKWTCWACRSALKENE